MLLLVTRRPLSCIFRASNQRKAKATEEKKRFQNLTLGKSALLAAAAYINVWAPPPPPEEKPKCKKCINFRWGLCLENKRRKTNGKYYGMLSGGEGRIEGFAGICLRNIFHFPFYWLLWMSRNKIRLSRHSWGCGIPFLWLCMFFLQFGMQLHFCHLWTTSRFGLYPLPHWCKERSSA